ncbi:hypothetical protein E8E13_007317 [Curvularia kusanoi]|uniref:Rhodopsin domain-containing protein n=1 Tax=Curvularia kusanoi TaxID=90978 RepID=A0A9P4T9L9_CURKU|nr:hypothetical protein E8E13_007317 [Curvularia kusanoi]
MTTLTNVSATATSGDEGRMVRARGVQSIAYASTVLFICTLGLSKISLLTWLGQLQLSKTYKMCRIMMGCIVIFYMLASATGVILQCQLSGSWSIGKAHCLSPYLLWTAIIAVDIALDMSLIFLPVFITTSITTQSRNEVRAIIIFSLRTMLIIPSLTRMVYLQQPLTPGYMIPQDSLPYIVTSQVHLTLAVLISCTTAFPYLTNLIEQNSPQVSPLRKHWSTSTLGSEIAEDYFASAPTPASAAIQTSNLAAQALIATPSSSRVHTMDSIHECGRSKAGISAPVRPAPPKEHQRPDMSLFVRQPALRPPPVTLLRGEREGTTTERGVVKKVQFNL